jgi:hypothetical protein
MIVVLVAWGALRFLWGFFQAARQPELTRLARDKACAAKAVTRRVCGSGRNRLLSVTEGSATADS